MTEALESRTSADIGFLTMAYGAPEYVEMAVDMALSLREWHAEPIAIAVDEPSQAYIANHYPGLFDTVVRFPASLPIGKACKFGLGEISPFRRTVFIDADTVVLGSLRQLLTEANDFDFAMMGNFHTSPTTETQGGFSVDGLMRDFGLDRYFCNHSGAFTFEREYARHFLADCLHVWTHEHMTPLRRLSDEVTFGIVAARRGMMRMREPYPVYWPNELRALDPAKRWKPLCHLFLVPPRSVMKWLMAEVLERRRRAGLSSLSIGHWHRKPLRRGMSVARQALQLTGHWMNDAMHRGLRERLPRP
jgi:hypothetical protein